MDWFYLSISVAAAVVITGVFHLVKRATYRKLNTYLLNGQYKEFEEYVHSKRCTFFMNRLEILNYRLNSAFLRNNRKDITACFDAIEKEKLPMKFKCQVFMQALNYYVSIQDQDKAKEYLDKINTLPNNQLKQEANILYDVYIAKGDQYLDLLLQRIEQQQEMFSGVDEFLVSLIYQNRNDQENYKLYTERATKHMAMLDEHLKNKKK